MSRRPPAKPPVPTGQDGLELVRTRLGDKLSRAALRERSAAAMLAGAPLVADVRAEMAAVAELVRATVRAHLAGCALTGPTGRTPPDTEADRRALLEQELASFDRFDADLLAGKLSEWLHHQTKASQGFVTARRPCPEAPADAAKCPCHQAPDPRCAIRRLWDEASAEVQALVLLACDQRRTVAAEIDRAVDAALAEITAVCASASPRPESAPLPDPPPKGKRQPKPKRPGGKASERLTIADFAARVGCTAPWARKLVRDGVLPALADGSLPWARAWNAWTEHRRLQAAWRAAHLRDRQAAAQERQLELDLARGVRVPVDDVRADASTIMADVRRELLALGGRLAPYLEGRPVAERPALLAFALEEVLARLDASRFAGARP